MTAWKVVSRRADTCPMKPKRSDSLSICSSGLRLIWCNWSVWLVIVWARLEREHSNPNTLHRLNRVRLFSCAAAFRWPETVWLNVFLINLIYWLHHNVYSKLSFDLRGGARICINRGWIPPLEPFSSSYLLHLILQIRQMLLHRGGPAYEILGSKKHETSGWSGGCQCESIFLFFKGLCLNKNSGELLCLVRIFFLLERTSFKTEPLTDCWINGISENFFLIVRFYFSFSTNFKFFIYTRFLRTSLCFVRF